MTAADTIRAHGLSIEPVKGSWQMEDLHRAKQVSLTEQLDAATRTVGQLTIAKAMLWERKEMWKLLCVLGWGAFAIVTALEVWK